MFKSIDQVPKEVPVNVYDKILNLSQAKTGGLAFQLDIKIGARVMLTSNINICDKLINGQIGSVVYFLKQDSEIKAIYVKFDDGHAGCEKIKTDRLAQQYSAVPIERITTEIRTIENKLSSPVIKRTQFPLMLSWACTVHKVQGLSLDKAVVSFDLLRQRSFNNGQMYVALSRVTLLEGFFLTGKFNHNAIVFDKKAQQEYQYLRENLSVCFEEGLVNSSTADRFTLSVCNVKSLRKHVHDLFADKSLASSDVILCTETQLTGTDNADDIEIDGFSLTCHNSEHKYSSLAAYIKNNLRFSHDLMFEGFSVLHIQHEMFLSHR